MNNTRVQTREPGWVPGVNSLGARLALVRQAMGWNIAEAATMCGVPIASWRNWESRGKEPRGLINVAMKIAGVTGVDFRWLALGPNDQPAGNAAPVGSDTLRYGLTSHVVAVGGESRSTVNNHSRDSFAIARSDSTRRTRPIGLPPLADGSRLKLGSNDSVQ